MLPSSTSAVLGLADGTFFRGYSIGAKGYAIGEVVFNTSITGYQEILTDPSYARQIVMFTYPHIGNIGVNVEDIESARVCAAGLVIRDLPALASNFRMEHSLSEYLIAKNIVAIAGIDTRKLTRIQRDKGVQNGAIISESDDTEKAIKLARSFQGLSGIDLAKVVSTNKQFEWKQSEWHLGNGYGMKVSSKYRVVAFDFGIKYNILRMLTKRKCHVTVLPAQSSAKEALSLSPDGIFLSNGPGDPEPCNYAISATKIFLERGIPIFGICFGHQIMGLAVGAKTIKMKIGHHGTNHPVKDLIDGRIVITSQNHGFAIDINSLPENVRITHISLFDGTLQGFELIDRPAFCFQGHPEASPGPHDADYLFDRFIEMMDGIRTQNL
ncbi:MAG: glutamine-hydrolyzing carbamoyl-phosphate synthase small subunit [Burkholderia sp.]|nr:glutamine-hydrolyzing carbamoyl-phosphate synthase small subunit [Burkholderia sp.]